MEYLLLFITAFFISLQNILRKQYNDKAHKPTPFLFSLSLSLSAMLFFLAISGFKLSITPGILIYSLGFAISYGAALVGSVYAFGCGSLSLSMLINSYSLIIPALHGFIALADPVTATVIIGLALLMISLLLINFKKEKVKPNIKWLVWISISFVGNGMCSLTQKLQQLKFDGAYKSEFMIVALIMCSAILATLAAINKEYKNLEPKLLLSLGSVSGIANGIVNYLAMALSAMLPSSILYPSISAGSIVMGFVAAIAIWREKLSKMQYVGYAVGVVSIILLNI